MDLRRVGKGAREHGTNQPHARTGAVPTIGDRADRKRGWWARRAKGAPLPTLRMVLLALIVLPLTAQAQDFPARPIRIIVPNPPGGAGDISARLIGQKLSESLRQPVVVENQAGASGAIGMNMLKRAAPDGGTIGVLISLAQTLALIQNKTLSFTPLQYFHPITA